MTPLDQMMDLSPNFVQHMDTLHKYLVVVIEIVMWLMYYLNIIYISLDKVFLIQFHLKYSIFFTFLEYYLLTIVGLCLRNLRCGVSQE